MMDRTRPMLVLVAAALLLPALPVVPSATPSSTLAAPWTAGPVATDAHDTLPAGIPYGEGRHMRVLLRAVVGEDLLGASNIPVTHTVDLAAVLRDAALTVPEPHPSRPGGQLKAFELDPASVLLVEVDPMRSFGPVRTQSDGSAATTPTLVFLGDLVGAKPFDPVSNPVVTLQWVLDGPTQGDRFFFLYFDTLHNGAKTPDQPSPHEAGRIAAAVGPGRGTQVYVPLHPDLGIPSSQDPRTVRVTNLQGPSIDVDVLEYDRFGLPESQPRDAFVVPEGIGSTYLYRYNPDQKQGALLLDADGLIAVEASSAMTSASFAPGSARLFLPSVDGGYVGASFAETAAIPSSSWYVFCAATTIPPGADACTVRFNGGEAVDILPNGFWVFSVVSGQPNIVEASVGEVAVQRVPQDGGSDAQRALTSWPPLDGPALASTFVGHSLSEDLATLDRLVLASAQSGSQVAIRSLVGSRDQLADSLDVGEGLFTDPAGIDGWGTSWQREWRLKGDFSARPEHRDGPARIKQIAGSGLSVASGHSGGDTPFSSLIPLQSPDGGLHYHFVIPSGDDGAPMGRLVLFSPYAGTNVVAAGVGVDGEGPQQEVRRTALLANQFVDDLVTDPGSWKVSADRPVLMAWLRQGSEAFSGIAPAITDLVTVQVEAAQYSGYLFDLVPDEPFKSGRPQSRVEFAVTVRNLAQTVTGEPIADTIELSARPPNGWSDAQVIPSTLQLAPGGVERVLVSVPVPSVDPTSGGATVTLGAASVSEPRLEVTTDLRINFKIDRDVLVTADGQTPQASKEVGEGEATHYLVKVLNTGGTTDRFDLSFSPPGPEWTVDVTCLSGPMAGDPCLAEASGTTAELSSGEAGDYLFEVARAPGSTGVSRLVTQILATSQGDPSVSGGVRLLTTTETNRSFQVTVDDATRVVVPGDQTTYKLVVRNDAEVDEELTVDVGSVLPPGWTEPTITVRLQGAQQNVDLGALNHTFQVPASGSAHLFVTQSVPENEAPLLVALDHLTFRSTLAPTAPSRNVDLRVLAAQTAGITLEPVEAPTSVLPGTNVSIAVLTRSTGNGNQSVALDGTVLAAGGGWSMVDAEGNASPWRFDLPAFGTRNVTIRLHVPHDAPPSSGAPARLEFMATVSGHPAVTLPVELSVARQPRIDVGELQMSRTGATTISLHLPLQNSGNVPLDLRTEWVDLPDAWLASVGSGHLAVGAQTAWLLNVSMQQPSFSQRDEAMLQLVDEQSDRVLASVPVAVDIDASRLEGMIEEVRPIGDAYVYRVVIENTGGSPAHGVDAVLRQGDEEFDRVTFAAILPGGRHIASLLGPAPTAGTVVHVTSADDAQGLILNGGDPEFQREPVERPVPGPAVTGPILMTVAVAAVAAAARRWSR